MRKLMNKKGFSLVELMIVVVIMGILIAVAIPLYGAITDNAHNKTCSTNIKNIKANAAAYQSSYDAKVTALDDIAEMFDDNQMPKCPIDKTKEYSVSIDDKGAAQVKCPNKGTDNPKHNPEGHVDAPAGTALA